MVASMESKQTYYIFHISNTNSKICIGLPYIRLHFVWWLRLHNCTTLVCDLPTFILVRAAVSLLTFRYCSSWNLFGLHLIFCQLTLPTCYSFSRKCIPVEFNARHGARVPIFTYTISSINQTFWRHYGFMYSERSRFQSLSI